MIQRILGDPILLQYYLYEPQFLPLSLKKGYGAYNFLIF